MKTKLFLLLFITTFLSGCKSDDNKNNTLPPATQTGVGTFACYVNGKAFIDKSGGWFNCYYQLVDGGYYFGIGGNTKRTMNNGLWSIGMGTYNKTISEGKTLLLVKGGEEGNAFGGGGFSFPNIYYIVSETNSEYTGELTITKLDFEKRIVSGTFSFDLQHPVTGERIEIREGRFDTLFTM